MSLAWIVLLILHVVLLGWMVIVFKRLVRLRNNTGDLCSFTQAVGSGLGSQIASFPSLPGSALAGGGGAGGGR
ncbi:MAG: hypothetical protein ABI858_05905 [Pseudoxanthomonas sp.]